MRAQSLRGTGVTYVIGTDKGQVVGVKRYTLFLQS
jgi:hypothetical protein